MRIVIAGSSGHLGTALTARLRGDGHDVARLVRREPAAPEEIRWDPYRGPLDPAALSGADAVVNLCGAGVGDHRWSPAYKGLIRASRVEPTRTIAEAVAAAGVPVLLNGSAVGYYGGSDSEVDESAPPSGDFLGLTCKTWEAATEPASAAGARVVLLRTGLTLGPGSAILKRLVPVVKFGLGGRFGSGRQWFSWISERDWVDATLMLLAGEIAGPVNLVGPTPATNADLIKALGNALGRPTPWVVPGFALRAVVGEAAVELLRGALVKPRVLTEAGYVWSHASVTDTVRWALGR
ncbi:hypothetical protein Afil01_47400 [Actinorhabdospora filicis]|uniref:TIGR01777 family protein n=1 Tax=Actinorhabdospora filicis TaxID=1785913 RepID=A0A9W6SPV4_9ACTN|nr:TIGR01777 family oxidoreductase [Actinorhabdospora filicis]GLZ79933.1 hypothetical protein Afil01_47400 [Actinorhabdospora filicis]